MTHIFKAVQIVVKLRIAQLFCSVGRHCFAEGIVKSHCLMTNHVHLLLKKAKICHEIQSKVSTTPRWYPS
jgi:hypothetical protein